MFLFLFFLLSLLLLTFQRLQHFKTFSSRGIPGPPPSFWTGNLLDIRGSDSNPVEKMTEWGHKYGRIYGYFAGTRRMLVVSDLDLVKDILVKNFKDFKDRPHLILNVEPVPNTLVGLSGNRWRKVRSLLSPVFSNAKMRAMSEPMNECIETTLRILEERGSAYVGVDVWPLFQGLTCHVISKCALAMEVNVQDNKEDPFLLSVQGFLANAINPLIKVSLCFPAIARISEFMLNALHVSHKMTKMIIKSVKGAMETRRKQEDNYPEDMLQFMLEAGKGGLLSDEEIVANAWVFILGGFETTASALTLSTFLIAKHSKVQEKLYQELKNAFKEEEVPTYDKLKNLPYLDQVISECLRLYPPIVTFVTRRIEKEVQIGPYLIPKGVNIQVPLWQVHHDPNNWPDPETFDPERFSPLVSSKRHSMSFIPFGAGPRCCVGARFAFLEVKMALARILRRFRIHFAPGQDQNLKLGVPTVTLVPKHEINLIFTPRNT